MDPRDEAAMLGTPMRDFLKAITQSRSRDYRLHFVTARQMTNILLAACDGHEGNPSDYRDYRFRLVTRVAEERRDFQHLAAITERDAVSSRMRDSEREA
jgi:hypothetical protein